jgi:hypothetical protein
VLGSPSRFSSETDGYVSDFEASSSDFFSESESMSDHNDNVPVAKLPRMNYTPVQGHSHFDDNSWQSGPVTGKRQQGNILFIIFFNLLIKQYTGNGDLSYRIIF